jgi:hypothetical protein
MKFGSIYLLHGKDGSPNGSVRLLEDALRALLDGAHSCGRVCPTPTIIGQQRTRLISCAKCR